jgi:REP element-mobilizing transposase RayT
MDLPVRKKLPHTLPQWVPDGSSFFITIKCNPPVRNQLCSAGVGDAVLTAMAYNHEHLVWRCQLCLLMPDHLHAIIAFPAEPGMQTLIKNWKKFVAGKCGVKWQRDFFDYRLRDHHELQEKAEYVLMNPVRKGLCERMEDWVWVYRPKDRSSPFVEGKLGDPQRDTTACRGLPDLPKKVCASGSDGRARHSVRTVVVGCGSFNGAHGVRHPTIVLPIENVEEPPILTSTIRLPWIILVFDFRQ